jgi:hypothetical protein
MAVVNRHLHHTGKVVVKSQRSVHNNFRNLTTHGIEDNYVTAIQQPSGGRASARRGGKS